jgi:hypothetical protein
MKSARWFFVLAGLTMLMANTVFAQNSKATADVSVMVRCNMTTAFVDNTVQLPGSCVDLFTGNAVAVEPDAFVTIMEKTVKVSGSQSLFVTPSLVTGLYTRTQTSTRTKGSTTTSGFSQATAMGGVYLRAVIVDTKTGKEIVGAPISFCQGGILGCTAAANGDWGVMLDSRIQTLSQALSDCVVNITTIGTNAGTCDFTSTINLISQTTSAHTYQFVFPSIGQGVYTVKIKAAVGSGASVVQDSGSGTVAVGAAAFGLGVVTIETVRLVHDFSF